MELSHYNQTNTVCISVNCKIVFEKLKVKLKPVLIPPLEKRDMAQLEELMWEHLIQRGVSLA